MAWDLSGKDLLRKQLEVARMSKHLKYNTRLTVKHKDRYNETALKVYYLTRVPDKKGVTGDTGTGC